MQEIEIASMPCEIEIRCNLVLEIGVGARKLCHTIEADFVRIFVYRRPNLGIYPLDFGIQPSAGASGYGRDHSQGVEVGIPGLGHIQRTANQDVPAGEYQKWIRIAIGVDRRASESQVLIVRDELREIFFLETI